MKKLVFLFILVMLQKMVFKNDDAMMAGAAWYLENEANANTDPDQTIPEVLDDFEEFSVTFNDDDELETYESCYQILLFGPLSVLASQFARCIYFCYVTVFHLYRLKQQEFSILYISILLLYLYLLKYIFILAMSFDFEWSEFYPYIADPQRGAFFFMESLIDINGDEMSVAFWDFLLFFCFLSSVLLTLIYMSSLLPRTIIILTVQLVFFRRTLLQRLFFYAILYVSLSLFFTFWLYFAFFLVVVGEIVSLIITFLVCHLSHLP